MRRKMAIGRHSVFCGAPCFRRAWQRSMTHKSTGPDVPVQRATTKRGATRRAGASDDADFHEHQRPRDDSVDEDPTEWVEVCTDRVFSPGPRDVGRRFRLECSAVRHDGTLLFGPRAIRIEPVLGTYVCVAASGTQLLVGVFPRLVSSANTPSSVIVACCERCVCMCAGYTNDHSGSTGAAHDEDDPDQRPGAEWRVRS